jgi:hypothetical protein
MKCYSKQEIVGPIVVIQLDSLTINSDQWMTIIT